jgi:hypothetical protein
MAAWMHACASVTTTEAAPVVSDSASMLPTAQRDVVDVLAAMILTSIPEVTA